MEYYRAVLLMQTRCNYRKLCSGEMASKSEDYEVRIWLDMPKRGCHLSALIGSLFTPRHFFRNKFPSVIDLPVSDHVKPIIGLYSRTRITRGGGNALAPSLKCFSAHVLCEEQV